MTGEEKVARWLTPLEARGGIGVEIGAFKTPIKGISPIYVDRFAEYAGEKCLADYFGDATSLPFHDNSLDYVASSHVLEHLANPIAAFKEWHRVLRHSGIIYMIIPDRRFTFDHRRPITPVEHLIADFEHATTPVDSTHIDDFVYGVDWSMFSPETIPSDVPTKQAELAGSYRAAVAGGNEINIHFHVFEPSSVRALILELSQYQRTQFDWEIIDEAERFPQNSPNGYLAVIRVKKARRDRLAGAVRRLFARDRSAVVKSGAKVFPH